MATIIRAWVYSVLTCIGVIAVFASIMQALTGRWEHAWHNVTDVTAASAVGSFPFLIPGGHFWIHLVNSKSEVAQRYLPAFAADGADCMRCLDRSCHG